MSEMGLVECAGYDPVVLKILRQAQESGIKLVKYLRQGYDAEQLNAIMKAHMMGVDIDPYLNTAYRGSCITEIAEGLLRGLDVSVYADTAFTWRKMREIRLGLEENIDVSKYSDPVYSYWQMREIRLGLQENVDVSGYADFMYTAKEMRKRRIILLCNNGDKKKMSGWNMVINGQYDLCVSPDGLTAYFNWHAGRPLRGNSEIEEILKTNGIVYGIDQSALLSAVSEYGSSDFNSAGGRMTVVARGTAPKNGRDGYYEWKFNSDRNRIPCINEDGSIDFDGFNWFDSVKEDQVVAVYHFATAPKNGRSVYGNEITAHAGSERPALKGRGFRLMPDLCTYKASEDGHVYLKNNELIIEKLYVVDGMDSSSKPVRHNGDVYISGNIEGPVELTVGGDLVVEGYVRDAKIKCGGSVLLKSGINNIGEMSKIRAGGCIISKFFEYTSVHADGSIYFGKSLNSNLCSYGEIVSYGSGGGIIGGTSYSEKGFCLGNVGNDSGIRTVLTLGSNSNINSVKHAFEVKTYEVKDTLTKLMNACNKCSINLKLSKSSNSSIITKLESAIDSKSDELRFYSERMDKVNRRRRRAFMSKIIVDNVVHDNVEIRYLNRKYKTSPGSHMEYEVKDDVLSVRKLFEDGVTA